MKNIVASAAEAAFGTIFLNSQEATPICTTLEKMNWPQPFTPIQVDNATAVGLANQNVKQKMSKAMNMRYFWICDRIKQNQFKVYWQPGKTNLADSPSKHYPPAHHIKVQPKYVSSQ